MIVIDDFLRKDHADLIINRMLDNDFPWYYNRIKTGDISNPDDIEEELDMHNQQMFNAIYKFEHMINKFQSPTMPVIMPILQKLKPLALLRIKANLQFGTETQYQSHFHTDSLVPENVPYFTAVYYLNTNNGYTIFEESGEKVESVENRIVIFDGKLSHAGSTCTNARKRAVININFIPSLETDLEGLKNDK